MKRRVRALAGMLVLGTYAAFGAVPDGYVVRVDSSTVYLDWGTASGVQVGDRFDMYREGEPLKHPVTGEILGKTEETLGSGMVQSVEPKFALGHFEDVKGSPKAGDRTRWAGSSISVVAPAAIMASSAPAIGELWRSESLEKEPVGIAFADLDGDGKKDIVVAYRKKIMAYRYADKKLVLLATFDSSTFRRILAVDTMDLQHDGHEDIFATVFLDGLNRSRVVVLRYEKGAFRKLGDFSGFARAIQGPDGTRHLYWQDMSRSRDLNFTAVSELKQDKTSYKPGPSIDLKLFNDQLFGFAWGDWYKTGVQNIAVLEHGERVRVFSPDVKWKSSEVYGGTKNDFPFENNALGAVYPRLFSWRASGGDRDQLLIPTNTPDLGVHMTYLKRYRRSEVAGLEWNGLEMKQAWRIPIEGYLADYGIADILGTSRPQLWVAAAGPGDKTVLISYSLP